MLSTLLRHSVFPLLAPETARPWRFLRPVSPAYPRRVALDFKVRDFRVKTIDSMAEFRQVLSLRRTVFHLEFAGKKVSFRSDKDEFDASADHLAIFDEKAGCLAGVYRMIPSHIGGECQKASFYSNTEFTVGSFLSEPGAKVELSRACIRREYRNGVVIALLWKGIAEYVKAAGSDYLFGLSSINTTDVQNIARISNHFAALGLNDFAHGIVPQKAYRINGYDKVLARVMQEPLVDARDLVPSLFKTYIKAGAKICSEPVLDQAFNCADWLTILDMRQLAAGYDRKFMKN